MSRQQVLINHVVHDMIQLTHDERLVAAAAAAIFRLLLQFIHGRFEFAHRSALDRVGNLAHGACAGVLQILLKNVSTDNGERAAPTNTAQCTNNKTHATYRQLNLDSRVRAVRSTCMGCTIGQRSYQDEESGLAHPGTRSQSCIRDS